MLTDLPLYLDETGMQQSEEVMKAIVYMVSNGQGRMRGQKDGELRETGTWKTVALTTGGEVHHELKWLHRPDGKSHRHHWLTG